MKTDNIFIASLSIIVNKDSALCMREAPYKNVLVERKGNYPNDLYRDIHTGDSYRADKQTLNIGDLYIDTLLSFNYVTGNKKKNLLKEKILKIYENVVGGK